MLCKQLAAANAIIERYKRQNQALAQRRDQLDYADLYREECAKLQKIIGEVVAENRHLRASNAELEAVIDRLEADNRALCRDLDEAKRRAERSLRQRSPAEALRTQLAARRRGRRPAGDGSPGEESG